MTFRRGQIAHNKKEIAAATVEKLFAEGLSKNQAAQRIGMSDAALWKRIKASPELLKAYRKGVETARRECCKGHVCDDCAICRTGRCCRNDDAEYKLPKTGDWGGQIFGQIGIFNDDDCGKAECHACGKAFDNVGGHAWNTHNLTTDEYRAIFGLNRTLSLVGRDYSERLSAKAKTRTEQIEKLTQVGTEYLANRTLEQKQLAGGRSLRPQAKIAPKNVELRERALQKAHTRHREKVESGTYTRRKFTEAEIEATRIRRKKEWAENPEKWANLLKSNAQKSKNARAEVVCQICGTTFEALKRLNRMVCSIKCRNRMIGRNNHERAKKKAQQNT